MAYSFISESLLTLKTSPKEPSPSFLRTTKSRYDIRPFLLFEALVFLIKLLFFS